MFSSSTSRRARRGILREWRLFLLSIFSLAVAFVCLGSALLVVVNLRAVEQRWARAGRASIYLEDNAPQADVDAVMAALEKVPGVAKVRYVSSGQAQKDMMQDNAASELAALAVEAFPASIEVDVAPEMTDEELADAVAKLKQLPSVEGVETYQSWTERLSKLVRGGVAASLVLALVVFASVLAVVGSTIRLALQRRRVEVEVLRLVGATDRFVKGPFVIEGGVQGAVGAAAAVGLLAVLFLLVRGKLDSELALLLGIEPSFLPWQLIGGMILAGSLLGAMAASLGLRKLVTV
jgi:cell division transport system permease protein